MSVALAYRGRVVSERELAFIRELIERHPGASRRMLSKRLCEAWGWVQQNGEPRDMVCRGLMLALHRAGHIELPPRRVVVPNNVVVRRRPAPVAVDRTPLLATLAELGPLSIRAVRRTSEERLCDALIEEHHHLGYTRPVGEHLKYVVWAAGRPLAAMAWSSAPRHLGPRDRFIGWSAQARRANIRSLAYNTRYLILPWVRVPHLASHLLGRIARRLPEDWKRVYGHTLYYLESFIDPARHRGTCYRAANWIFLGLTTGRGKDAPTSQPTRPKKEVLGYPLCADFRDRLSAIP